jgi:predicted nucleotidyltransferase
METKTLKKIIIPILKKQKISKAGLFGSYARQEQKKSSDIDILIKAPASLSLLDLVQIKLQLEKSLNKKVDLVEYQTIKPKLKKQILKEEIKLV